MIPTVSNRPVPVAFPTVPSKSAPAASKPTKAPEKYVTGGIYLSRISLELMGSYGNQEFAFQFA